MRLSLASAVSCGVAMAFLAGCSGTSQGTIPGGAQAGASQTRVSQSGASRGSGLHGFVLPPKVISREQLKQLHPNVLPPGFHMPKMDLHHKIHVDKTAIPTMALADDGGYVWFISKKGAVAGYATDCSGAEGGVVDHSGRVVVACTNSQTINVYNKGNTTGPANLVLSDSGLYPADAFEDSSGNIYATNLYGFYCTAYYCYFQNGNIVWWSTGNQGSFASPSGSYQDPNLIEDFFADVDASGKVYVDGIGEFCSGYYCYETPEVDQITNITGSASSSNQNIALGYPGMVYAMGNGNLAIGDQGCFGCGNNALYIYNDPPTVVSATLKSPQNFSNTCDPVGGGFNMNDSQVVIGDAGCRAADLGKVHSNKWKSLLNINFSTPIGGMFLTSDK